MSRPYTSAKTARSASLPAARLGAAGGCSWSATSTTAASAYSPSRASASRLSIARLRASASEGVVGLVVVVDMTSMLRAVRHPTVNPTSPCASGTVDPAMVRVGLLGELAVQVGGRTIEPPPSRRAWSLLAWLALHPGEHARGSVAAVFWPDVLDASARASLRSAAWALRRALGPAGADALTGGRDRIGLRCETDLGAFEADVAAGELESAVARGAGPLLAGLDEDWVLDARDEHAQRLGAVLARLAATAPTPEAAVSHARRRLALDPLDESAARDLIERLVAAGDRSGALAVGDRLAERLRTQLGIAPSAQTRERIAELRTDAAPGAGPEGTPLLGRRAELAELEAAWASAAGGRGAVVVLEGEGGIGKTRLAAELAARARAAGARTATCAALEPGAAPPLAHWSQLLRELAPELPPVPDAAYWPDELAALVPSFPARLGRSARPTAALHSPEAQRARLSEATVDALEHAASDGPLLLRFEDVHLADPGSIELLGYVARRIGDLPVLLLLTRRYAPARPDLDGLLVSQRSAGRLAEIELEPLSRTVTDALVRATTSLPAGARDEVVTLADGNPLLALEAARAAASGQTGPPASLRAVVRAAIGALPEPARRVAELAAAAGRGLEHPELTRLAEAGDVLRAIDSGLLASDDGRFGYRHALLREAALAELPDLLRRERHAELAEALRGSPAETAHHLRHAGEFDAAARALVRAAREAVRIGALEDAAERLQEARELLPGDARLPLELAGVEAWRGRREAADAALDAALALAPPDEPELRALAHLEAANWYSGALCWPRRTLEHGTRAVALLDALPRPDPKLQARALALQSWGEANAGDLGRAEATLARAEGLADDDPDLRAEIENARAFAQLRSGDLEGALATFLSSADRDDLAPDAAYRIFVNASCLEAARGNIDAALHHADRGLELAGQLPSLAAELHAVRATVLGRLGRHGEARTAIAAERAAADRSGDIALLERADFDEGMVRAGAGEHEAAVQLLHGALEGLLLVSRPVARLARAEALARIDRTEEAEAELREVALEPVGPADRPAVLVARLTFVQGLVARARGDIALARARLSESADAWGRLATAHGPEEYLGNLVDLGRPTIGTVAPRLELGRSRYELDRLPVPVAP